ncbi:MAG: LytTR family DNA-binding domain-containing protein [Bacteroidota bacterium]
MFQQLLEQLNAPYPEPEHPKKLAINIIGAGLFIAFFLFLFRPFGLSNYRGNTFLLCMGFGVVTILIGWCYEWVSFGLFNIRKDLPSWTLKKWILSSLTLITFIACGNFIYMNLITGWNMMELHDFIGMLYSTILVGIIPTTFAGLSVQIRAAKRNQQKADIIQAQLSKLHTPIESLTLQAQNQKQQLTIQPQDLYFVESMQNYVAIHFREEAKMKKKLLRNTIANLDQQLHTTAIMRCHRSFLVNTDLIEQVEGNAQGLRLQLKGLATPQIPVSRKYIPLLRQQLAEKTS